MGPDASVNLKLIDDAFQNHLDIADVVIEQSNFRLRQPIPIEAVRFWLINILKWHPILPEVKLHEINVA